MPEASPLRRLPWGCVVVGLLLSVGLAITAGWMSWDYYAAGQSRLGPEQPIPFSHRLHASKEIDGGKDIDCRFCHTGVEKLPRASLPPIQTCLFCHNYIITEHPEIRRLHRYNDEEEPIPWVRVYEVPDHVYFTHRMHIRRAGLECVDCHGEVERMDRLRPPRELKMGFCLECHRPRGASTDCWTCHR